MVVLEPQPCSPVPAHAEAFDDPPLAPREGSEVGIDMTDEIIDYDRFHGDIPVNRIGPHAVLHTVGEDNEHGRDELALDSVCI